MITPRLRMPSRWYRSDGSEASTRLTCRLSTITGPGVSSVERRCIDRDTEPEQTFSAACEHIERPGLQAFMAPYRRRVAKATTESGDDPERSGEKDLDAVVDRVLHEKQGDAHGRELQAQPDHIGGRGGRHGERERDDGECSHTQHRRNRPRPSFPPRPSRFGGEHRADRIARRSGP